MENSSGNGIKYWDNSKSSIFFPFRDANLTFIFISFSLDAKKSFFKITFKQIAVVVFYYQLIPLRDHLNESLQSTEVFSVIFL